jgi:hypothetical protein
MKYPTGSKAGLEEARRRTVECLRAGNNELDLGGLGLRTFPGGLLHLIPLQSLRSLDLRGNHIGHEGAKALSSLVNLTSLDLRKNRIGNEGAKVLSSLISLISLNLNANSIRNEGARALSSLVNLTSLDLRKNRIDVDGAKALSSLVNLTSLSLGSNDIGADGAKALSSLVNLSSLNLDANGIGDDGAKALSSLVNLISLDLVLNHIGDEGTETLASLVNLTSLNLDSNDIGHEGAKALSSLVNLTSLSLGDSRIGLGSNHIGDAGAKALSSLVNLTSLNLDANGIGDEGAKALSSLVNLTSLDLERNAISDKGVKALATLVNLISLNLRGNRIDVDGMKALSALVSLTSLDLGGDSIPPAGALAYAGSQANPNVKYWVESYNPPILSRPGGPPSDTANDTPVRRSVYWNTRLFNERHEATLEIVPRRMYLLETGFDLMEAADSIASSMVATGDLPHGAVVTFVFSCDEPVLYSEPVFRSVPPVTRVELTSPFDALAGRCGPVSVGLMPLSIGSLQLLLSVVTGNAIRASTRLRLCVSPYQVSGMPLSPEPVPVSIAALTGPPAALRLELAADGKLVLGAEAREEPPRSPYRSPAELVSTALRARKALVDLSNSYRPAFGAGSFDIEDGPSTRLRMATIGAELHEAFFGHPDSSSTDADLKRIAQVIAQTSRRLRGDKMRARRSAAGAAQTSG